MPDKGTISHRGARYEIGRGKRYYGIWVTGAPESDPIDRWPETREGWAQAWARFTTIETPGTIVAVHRPRAGLKLPSVLPRAKRARAVGTVITGAATGRRRGPALALAGAGLLGFGVLLGLIGLFPGYVGSPSLASQTDQLVPHLLYLAAWAVSAVLILLGVRSRSRMARQSTLRQGAPQQATLEPGAPAFAAPSPGAAGFDITRTGALLGIGLSAVTFGLFVADLGEVISGGASLLGAGLVLSLLGWLACAAGSAVAFTARPGPGSPAGVPAHSTPPDSTPPDSTPPDGTPPDGTPSYAAPSHGLLGHALGRPARPRRRDAGPLALLVLAAIGTVATFTPSWDSYTLTQATTGTAQTITAGDAFANPGAVIAGNVAVMVAVVAVAVLAALWRPARQGAVLLAGAIVPLAAQAISALIQVNEPVTPSLFGISQAQASAAGLTITSGVTPIFWVYCVFVISLLISCAWMLTTPHYPAMPAPAPSPGPGPVHPSQSEAGEAGDSRDSDDGAEDDEESTYA